MRVPAAISAVLFGIAIVPSRADAYPAFGTGLGTCRSWSQARTRHESEQKLADEQWILGFLTGAGTITPKVVPLSDTSPAGVEDFVDTWCAVHPVRAIADAAVAFELAHPR